MDKVHFDIDGWMSFLAGFDPITEHSWINEFKDLDGIKLKRNQILAYTSSFQESPTPALPQEDLPSPLAKNLDNIYGEGTIRNWDYINAYRNALNNIVVRYISIEGFEQLFSSYYFRFEWMMHVTPDFIKGSSSLYRDHFLHQAKNAWMGYEYLHRFGWMDYVVDWLESNPKNTVAEHVNRAIREETLYRLEQDAHNPDHPIMHIVDIYTDALLSASQGTVPGRIKQCLHISKMEDDFINFCKERQRYFVLSALVRLELIQITWFIASLLHDIGYPVQHIRDQNKEIAKYLPSMDWPVVAGEQSYNHMRKLLNNSLLYKVVQEVDLREGYTNNAHGTVSALVMLNHFYQQSTVHGNSPLKQCAVDWAAVCIQQHTQKFQASSGNKSDRYIVDTFDNNALGFLLRLVDDLQEYDRFYFEIGHSHTLLFCNVCNQPLIHCATEYGQSDAMYAKMLRYPNISLEAYADNHKEDSSPRRRHTRYDVLKPHVYQCLCQPWSKPASYHYDAVSMYTNDLFFPVEQLRTFDYRKINTLVICREVTIEPMTRTKDKVDRFDISIPLAVTIRYDPWAMLMLLQINPRFLLYRVKGTNEIKRMLCNQLKLPTQVLRFFATINPLWLKAEILYRWLDESKSLQEFTVLLRGEEYAVDWMNDYTAERYGKLAQKLADRLEQKLLMDIYLNGSQCQGCDKAKSIDSGKGGCHGCAGMDAAVRSNTQRIYYQQLKNANTDADAGLDVKRNNAFCPAAQSAYRLYWRLRHAYAPMLVGYIVARGSAEPDDTTCWRKTNAVFDRWYLRQVDSLRCPQHDDINREAIAFMLDFRERGVDLWYWLNQSPSINKPDDVYFRQYEYLARQKKTLRNAEKNEENGEHNYDKWMSTPFADPNAKCLESFIEEDAIRDVASYVNNRQYTPHLYLKHNEDSNGGETGGYRPEWYAIDYFSDLKMILKAHQYAVMKEEQRRDEDVKAAGS